MRGVPVKTLRRWRAHRMGLLEPALTVAGALETLPPLSAGPSAYFSLWARVRPRPDPEHVEGLVAAREALVPHFANGLGDVLLPPDIVAPLAAARLYRVRRDTRRSRRRRQREQALQATAEPVVGTLSRSPAPLAELVPRGRAGAKAKAALDEMCARGRVRKSPEGAALDRRFRLALSPEVESAAERLLGGWTFLEDLALYYLKVAGPATRDDFAWWSGASGAAARRTIEELVGLVDEIDLEGGDQAHFMLEEDAAKLRRFVAVPSKHAALLPSLDPVRYAWSEGFASLASARVSPRVEARKRRRSGAIVAEEGVLTVGGSTVGSWTVGPAGVRCARFGALDEDRDYAVEAERSRVETLVETRLAWASGVRGL